MLYFINVRYPPNVGKLFLYSDWIYIAFYPEPFELESYGYTPERFQEKGVSDYFIENVLFGVFYIALALVLYPVTYMVKSLLEAEYAVSYKQQRMLQLPRKLSRSQSLQRIIYHQHQDQFYLVEYVRKQDFLDIPALYHSLYTSAQQYNLHFVGIVLSVINLTFLDFQMAAVLQLMFSPLDDAVLLLNLALSIASQLVIFAILYYYWLRLHQSQDTLNHPIYKQRFGLLYELFKVRRSYSQYYMLILTVKKILFMNFLIVFFMFPFVQNVSLLLVSLADIIFLIYDFPFVTLSEALPTLISEQMLFATLIGTTLLAY